MRARRNLIVLVCLLGAGSPAAAEPERDFPALAREVADKQLAKLGKGYVARVDAARHLIYVGAQDDQHLRETMELLAAFTDAYRRTLTDTAAPWGVTIVLPTTEDYKRLSPPNEVVGFYRPAVRTLVSVDRGRVLLHEFTHALHLTDAAQARQVHPPWVVEGLATLFEASEITPSGLRPQTDLRVLEVQKALRQKSAIPLSRLVAMGQGEFMNDAKLCYAQSRYVMLYLHEQGKLDAWYRRYKATYTKDPTGLKAAEEVLGNRVFQIEPAWAEWVAGLQLPRGELRSGQARLGAELRDDPRGVKVVGLVEGGAAKTAGRLRIGDIVTHFDGQEVRNAAEMVAAIRSAGAARTVTIGLIRHGRPTTVQQPLGSASDAGR